MDKEDSYRKLLFDKRWLEKKARIIQRDNYQCKICGSNWHLVVHHKQYHVHKNSGKKFLPWEYDNKYLVTLCESCHKKGHDLYDIPVKFI